MGILRDFVESLRGFWWDFVENVGKILGGFVGILDVILVILKGICVNFVETFVENCVKIRG